MRHQGQTPTNRTQLALDGLEVAHGAEAFCSYAMMAAVSDDFCELDNEFAVSHERVGANLSRCRLLDGQAQFLKRWFKTHHRGRRSSDGLVKQSGGIAVGML
jgi:hypothetical protein